MVRSGHLLLCSSLLLTMTASLPAMTHSRRGPTAPRIFNRKSPKVVKTTGQRAIDAGRATAIQAALIKQGYLSGEATGHWDSETQSAMQKLQADNGWQTKLVPDSRAIIKLGLGPAQEDSVTSGSVDLSKP